MSKYFVGSLVITLAASFPAIAFGKIATINFIDLSEHKIIAMLDESFDMNVGQSYILLFPGSSEKVLARIAHADGNQITFTLGANPLGLHEGATFEIVGEQSLKSEQKNPKCVVNGKVNKLMNKQGLVRVKVISSRDCEMILGEKMNLIAPQFDVNASVVPVKTRRRSPTDLLVTVTFGEEETVPLQEGQLVTLLGGNGHRPNDDKALEDNSFHGNLTLHNETRWQFLSGQAILATSLGYQRLTLPQRINLDGVAEKITAEYSVIYKRMWFLSLGGNLTNIKLVGSMQDEFSKTIFSLNALNYGPSISLGYNVGQKTQLVGFVGYENLGSGSMNVTFDPKPEFSMSTSTKNNSSSTNDSSQPDSDSANLALTQFTRVSWGLGVKSMVNSTIFIGGDGFGYNGKLNATSSDGTHDSDPASITGIGLDVVVGVAF